MNPPVPPSPPAAKPHPNPGVQQALERLARTREALQASVAPPPASRRARARAAGAPLPPPLFAGVPLLGDLSALVADWWSRLPLAPAVEAGCGEAGRALATTVRRRPLTSMAVAAGVGVLLVRARPWQVAALAPLWARHAQPLVSRASALAMQRLAMPAVQAALVGWLLGGHRASQSAPDAAPPNAPHAPMPAGAGDGANRARRGVAPT